MGEKSDEEIVYTKLATQDPRVRFQVSGTPMEVDSDWSRCTRQARLMFLNLAYNADILLGALHV